MLTDILYDVMMDLIFGSVITAAIAYLCGCFNGAVIVSKYILRDDIRNHGSGKAIAAVLLGVWIFSCFDFTGFDLMYAKYWAGLWCLLGHMFPCMFHFKGGKGILSGGTIAIMLDWRLALLVWGGFLILAVLTRYVSLGSVFAAAAFPIGTWLFVSRDPVIVALALFLGGLVLYMHRANIHRLLTGTENKFSLHKKK